METSICEHIEQLLPQVTDADSYRTAGGRNTEAILYTDQIDLYSDSVPLATDCNREEFIKGLEQYGLTEVSKELLAMRVVDGMTYKEIAKAVPFTSPQLARLAVERLFQKIREQKEV